MSLENDPFDTQPAPLPTTPPEPLPQVTGQYTTGAYGQPPAAGPRVPVAVWAGMGILAMGLCIAIILLLVLLLSGGGGGAAQPTPTPIPPQPIVVANPDVVSGGVQVTLQGVNFRPADALVFFLRDPAKPSEPILQIGSTRTDAAGRFTWPFTYPLDPRWTSISAATVIVQSSSTGAYVSVPLRVVASSNTPIPIVPPIELQTWTPVPTNPLPTPTSPPVTMPTLTQTPNPNEWRGEYFNNPNLQGAPVMVRNDASVNFDWGLGSPAANIPVDYFSVRWTRTSQFEGGMYRFTARADDGVRVWLDSTLVIDAWGPATPNTYMKDINVPAGQHVVRVDYFEGVGTAFINFSIDRVTSFPDWRGDYFNNQFLSGSPTFTRNDVAVSFDWSTTAPAPGVPNRNFSVRWTRSVEFSPGTYRFTIRVNGGTNLMIDGNLVIGQWNNNVNGTFTADYTLGAGQHTFEINYYNVSGNAYIWFTYQPLSNTGEWNGNYFANDRWSGIPTMVRFDPALNFDWSSGAPAALLPVDRFSVRWTRVLNLAAGLYQINVTVDDGVRVFIDNNVVLDQVRESSQVDLTTQVQLTQGNHEFRVEYVEYTGLAVMRFNLTPVNVFVTPTAAPPTPTFTPTPVAPPPTSTFTPVPPASATPAVPPVISSFVAQPAQVVVGAQCVALTWTTSNANTPITLARSDGQTWTNLSPSGSFPDCAFPAGNIVYTLTITASPYYGPVVATQNVVAMAPPTPTYTPTATPTIGITPR